MKLDPRKWLFFWCLMSPSLAYAYAESINPDFDKTYAMGICVGETLSKTGHANPADPEHEAALKKARFSCQLGAENSVESDATYISAPTEKLSNAPKSEVSRVAKMESIPAYDSAGESVSEPLVERSFERRSGMRNK